MKKVAFHTLGCKLNFSETSTIARKFEAKGFLKVAFEETPDIFVINTCSVTENADKKCKQVVKQARKVNPDAYVAIIGCFAQLRPKEIAEIHGVDAVLGAAEKFQLVEFLENLDKEDKAIVFASEIQEAKTFHPAYSIADRTRTFLKVQDGCDYSCTFCTIPLARGKSRSGSITEIIQLAEEIASTEVKEVVLTGVNIGDFGKPDETFLGLIKQLDLIDGIDRYRISSIEPNLLKNEIIDFVANSKKFVPHFHVPLQSGSDKLLKLMRRRYLRELYSDRVTAIKSVMPNACIGADVIVGFPGETDSDFKETYQFLNQLDISYLHVFTYSERANTPAVSFDGAIPHKVRSERSRMLHNLSQKKRRKFYEAHMGQLMRVLFESNAKDDQLVGFTENYIRVKTAYNPDLVNQIREVKIKDIDLDGLAVLSESHLITA
ncbi:MAG: tRNA (N(6)-L-threonylcarbamoyladenosine(37)-C(2))-methylthiotransferase MtaB [Cyclobacteriaceae bacterium]